MTHRQPASVNLEELAVGKMPERVIAAIGKMEVKVAEVLQWEASKPVVRLVAMEHELLIEIRARVPVKKALAVLGGLSGLLWVAIDFIVR